MTGITDPRSLRVEEHAYLAEQAARRGALDEASEHFARAAAIEQQIAEDARDQPPRVAAVLAVSAVALWYKAARWDEVEALAHHWLSSPGLLDEGSKAELRDLLQRAWIESQIEPGSLADTLPIELRLIGGHVRRGLAPAALVRDKQESLVTLLERIGEWMLGLPFREVGPSQTGRSFDVLQAPARAASYGIRLYLRSGMRDSTGQMLPTATLLETFFELAGSEPSELDQRVTDSRYRLAFLQRLHELCADGKQVSDVVCSAPTWRMASLPVHLDVDVRSRFDAALQRAVAQDIGRIDRALAAEDAPVEWIRGQLLALDLVEGWIDVYDERGDKHRIRLAASKSTSTGEPVERLVGSKVRVAVTRRYGSELMLAWIDRTESTRS